MGLFEFFLKHTLKVKKCENCGFEIQNPGPKNVAHILAKGKSAFPELAMNDDNIMYLCSSLDRISEEDGVGCHEKFDKGYKFAKKMKIWPIAVERFMKFEHLIKKKSTVLLHFLNDPNYNA